MAGKMSALNTPGAWEDVTQEETDTSQPKKQEQNLELQEKLGTPEAT